MLPLHQYRIFRAGAGKSAAAARPVFPGGQHDLRRGIRWQTVGSRAGGLRRGSRFYVGAGAFFPTTKSQTSQFGAPESLNCSGERLRLLWRPLFYIERSRYASPQGGMRLAAKSVGRSRSCTGLSGRKGARRSTAPDRRAGECPAVMRGLEKVRLSARREKSCHPFAGGGGCFAGPDGPFPSAPVWFSCVISGL